MLSFALLILSPHLHPDANEIRALGRESGAWRVVAPPSGTRDLPTARRSLVTQFHVCGASNLSINSYRTPGDLPPVLTFRHNVHGPASSFSPGNLQNGALQS